MSEQTLQSCPFCGAPARIKPVARDWWKIVIDHSDGCILSGHLDEAIVPQDDESKAELIERWNRRALAGAAEPVAWAAGDWLRAITETELAGIPNTGKDKGRRDRCRSMYRIPLFTAPQPSPEQAALLAEVEGLRKAIARAIELYPADSIAAPTCVQILRDAMAALSTKEREHD